MDTHQKEERETKKERQKGGDKKMKTKYSLHCPVVGTKIDEQTGEKRSTLVTNLFCLHLHHFF